MKHKFLILIVFFLSASMAYCQEDTIEELTVEQESFIIPNFDYLARVTADPSSRFYYPRLLERFKAVDTSMSLEELHCLYYGFTLQKNYIPYSADSEFDKAREIINSDNPSKRQLKRAIGYLDDAIANNPVEPSLYNYRFVANSMLYGEDNAEKLIPDYFHFMSLIEVIRSSGDGDSFPSAFYVISPSHEYDFIRYYGFRFTGQELARDGKSSFDIISVAENEYGVESIYFNIDVCFRSLSKIFVDVDTADDDADANNLDMASDDKAGATVPMGTNLISDTASLSPGMGRSRGMVIPINRKVVVRLHPSLTDDTYKIQILSSETVSGEFDFSNPTQYFPTEAEENIAIFYFVHGKRNDGKPCDILMFKSFCKNLLRYDSYILYEDYKEYQLSSNDGIFPEVCGVEIWNYKLSAIHIADIRIRK